MSFNPLPLAPAGAVAQLVLLAFLHTILVKGQATESYELRIVRHFLQTFLHTCVILRLACGFAIGLGECLPYKSCGQNCENRGGYFTFHFSHFASVSVWSAFVKCLLLKKVSIIPARYLASRTQSSSFILQSWVPAGKIRRIL